MSLIQASQAIQATTALPDNERIAQAAAASPADDVALPSAVDEHLPAGKLLTLGLQHVLVMYAGAIAVPLIIGRALNGKRLWATVEVAEETNLIISSAHCADEGLRAELDAHAEDLVAAGFLLIRCNERHGALAFELEVSELSAPEPAPAGDDGAE